MDFIVLRGCVDLDMFQFYYYFVFNRSVCVFELNNEIKLIERCWFLEVKRR